MRRISVALVLTAVSMSSLASAASAAPVVRFAAGANAAAIQTAVDQFRADLGGANNGNGGSFPTGRREINWDGVPDNFAEPNFLPFDFFNVNSPRGVVFESAANIGGQHRFIVSADSSNPTATPVRFGNIDPSYSSTFTTFSPERLFAADGATTIDVFFYLPGTNIPATVSGFGAVFADSDTGASDIEYYAPDGKKLFGAGINTSNNGLSFVGTSFSAGERVGRVEMILGNHPLAGGFPDGTAGVDVVALDDLIYGEPQADPSTFRFADDQVTGAEGTSARVSVVRSGQGPASVDVATSNGSATAGSDYTAVSSTLTFAPGETVKTVTVPLATDNNIEGDETVQLALSNPVGGSLGSPSNATLTISDRPPAAPAPDVTPPHVVLGHLPSRMTRARFVRGLSLAVTPSEPSSLNALLLGHTRGAVLARAGDLTLASRSLPLRAGKRTVKLRPKRSLVSHARRRFTARLRLTATDAAGNRKVVTRRIVVIRR